MKQTVLDNIRQLDISQGGGIFGEKTRVETINHPILIIGLGGTGTDALLRLKYYINRRFRLPENCATHQKKEKPDNIEYLAFETNEHDRKKYRGISLDPFTETVVLSNAGIGAILNNRSTLPDYISKWLSPQLTITDGTKGASGNRQAGRLLLFEKINTAIDAIDNKIKTLRTAQANKLLVFLLSGISGGTGGGMFLDIAYIVRGLMEREFGGKGLDKVEIGGYLFTPDVHLAANNLNIHTAEYIQRNGYAALKELDYFMNIEERGERFCQKYGTRLEVNSALAPFNLCHLVSACNIDGVFLSGAYDYCMNVTAESIANFLAIEDKESGNEFAIQDYHSNLISNIGSMKSNLPSGMQSAANFIYNIIGASAAILPTEGINSQMAHALFEELSPLFVAAPDEDDVREFARISGLLPETLGAELARGLPQIRLDYAETDYFSHKNVIKTRRVNVHEKLEQQFAAAKRELANGASKGISKAAIESAKRGLRDAFLNPKQGPIYAARLASDGLREFFDNCAVQLSDKISALTEEIDAFEVAAQNRFEAAKGALLLRERKKNAYIEMLIRAYEARLQREIFTRLFEMYKDIRAEILSESDTTYAKFDEILRELRKILCRNNSHLQSQPTETKNYCWDIVSVKETAAEALQKLQQTGFEALARDFAKFLYESREKWLSETEPDICNSFSQYISEKFEVRPMAEFLQSKGESEVDVVVETEIAPRLYQDAKPIFHMDNAAGIFNFPSYGMVSVPANAPEILRGIQAYQSRALANLRFNIRKSCITDRIFWLNTQNGVPLFAYTPIRVYEELYERTIHTKEAAGRHLSMSEADNWINLPSPLPEKLWGDTYENPRQKALNDQARQIFHNTNAPNEEASNFFIRCPNLISKAAREMSNSDIFEHENESNLTDEFLRVLVCEAIVKRGALYLYEKDLEEDPWPPFANLIDNADFPEYAMYNRFKNLDTPRKKMLRAKARSHERVWPEDKLVINLKKWQGKIACRKDKLDTEMWKWHNGKDMYNFYRNALLRLNTQISALAS